MKKSFMTRVLATGLSLAMAFSLTAATNVSVASAASTPAMASKQFAVRVGGAAKSYKASAATQKSYKISKATVGNTDKATVKVNSSKKSIKVTPGTVTGSTVVKISFKNIKTKKTTSKKYRCVVKAAVVEKQAIVKAEATGVKTITLTMAKDVASVASPVAITVKKGTTTRNQKATADGKTITLAMETKLNQGEYTIEIAGLENEKLTATLNVAMDETLTTYKISEEATLLPITQTDGTTVASTDSAIVMYYALNQYEEPMLADEPTATSSFSSKTDVTKVATATVPGEITITEIPTILALQESKGTMVLVDNTKGVNKTQDVTIKAQRTPKEVTVVGTYNINTAKMENLVSGVKLDNYYILLTAKDQYGWPVKEFTDDVKITIAGGLTNVDTQSSKATETTRAVTVDGQDYIAIRLAAATAQSGDYTMTIVNNKLGMLSNDTYKVTDQVIIKNVSIAAENGIYTQQENELSYDITDANGNTVTDYVTLKELVKWSTTLVRWEKNKDGSAKLVYDLTNVTDSAYNLDGGSASDTQSTVKSFTANINTIASGNYFVKPFQMTVKRARFIKAAQGLKADQVTNVAFGETLTFKYDKLTFADQYSNVVTSDDSKIYVGQSQVTAAAIYNNAKTGCSIYIENKEGAFTTATYSAVTGKFTFTACSTQAGIATVYLRWCNAAKDTNYKYIAADNKTYDAKFTVTSVKTSSVGTPTLKIASLNDGNAIGLAGTSSQAAISKAAIEVVSEIGGVKTRIPESQYEIIKGGSYEFTDKDRENKVKTKDVDLTIVVTTWDSNGSEFQQTLTGTYKVSWDAAKVNKVNGTASVSNLGANTVAGKPYKVITAGGLATLFEFKDQYGNTTTSGYTGGMKLGDVTYDVLITNGDPTEDYEIAANGYNQIEVRLNHACPNVVGGKYTVKVTATVNGTSKTKTLTFTY